VNSGKSDEPILHREKNRGFLTDDFENSKIVGVL
jgi:hypothetical protein